MRYIRTVDVHQPNMNYDNLQPGQWVTAGPTMEDKSNMGSFYGVKPSGTVVVAWLGNARRSGYVQAYNRTVQHFAKSR